MPELPRLGPCGCRPGVQRDNCPNCEGTGQAIDWRQYYANKREQGCQCGLAYGKMVWPAKCYYCAHGYKNNPNNVTVTGPYHITGLTGDK